MSFVLAAFVCLGFGTLIRPGERRTESARVPLKAVLYVVVVRFAMRVSVCLF